jgi:hypothetical protein
MIVMMVFDSVHVYVPNARRAFRGLLNLTVGAISADAA